MKKFVILLVLVALVTSTSGVFAQNLLDNADYRKGMEYQNLSKQAFDAGDYDKSMEYSALAKEHFQKAREYAEKMRQRYAAYNLKNRAADRIKYADYINAEKHYPLEYTGAKAAFTAAETAFTREEYPASIEGYNQTINLLKDIKPATPIPAEELAKADSMRATINKYDLGPARPAEMAKADAAYEAGKALLDKDNVKARELLAEAVRNYQLVIDGAAGDLAMKQQAEMEAARKRADGVNAMILAPEAYADGQKNQNFAEMQFRSKAYEDAWMSSEAAIKAYNNAYDIAKGGKVLPEYYTVRLIPDRRDCFWRIAEYDFVYGDPWKWRILYEANKHLIPDPNNPDLIEPGLKFKIPSLAGEKRSGEWQPK